MRLTKPTYAIIGLGVFGNTLGKLLSDNDFYVVGIDKDMDKVEAIKNDVAKSICFDATNTNLLDRFGIPDAEVVIVSIGDENFEEAEFIAMELQNRDLRKVYVTVDSKRREQIIKSIGVAKVINPKIQAAKLLADRLKNS